MKLNTFYFILFLLFILSCSRDKQTVIEGNIPNLPDGTVYLYKDWAGNKIDSIRSKNGVFSFTYKWDNSGEPVYLGIDHKDDKGISRLFSFPTHAKYRGSGWNTSTFLSDSVISIKGNIKDFTPKELMLTEKVKLVEGPPIITGRQTEVYYNTDGDFFDNVKSNKTNIIKEKIKQYPYSYHLLYKLVQNKNNYNADEIKSFMESFKGDITQSSTYKKLESYNQKRFNKKGIMLPLLEDENGNQLKVIDTKYKKHLIIFWASWCGPCKAEIPLLKKVHSKTDASTEFVSISIDNDENAWKKALKDEKMEWKQLIVNSSSPAYESFQIILKLNNAIPYTVLVNNNLKILASSTGLSSEEELNKLIETN